LFGGYDERMDRVALEIICFIKLRRAKISVIKNIASHAALHPNFPLGASYYLRWNFQFKWTSYGDDGERRPIEPVNATRKSGRKEWSPRDANPQRLLSSPRAFAQCSSMTTLRRTSCGFALRHTE